MAHECVDDPRIDPNQQVPQKIIIAICQLVNRRNFLSIEPEVREPIRSLPLSANRVCQPTFFPKAAYEDRAPLAFDEIRNGP